MLRFAIRAQVLLVHNDLILRDFAFQLVLLAGWLA